MAAFFVYMIRATRKVKAREKEEKWHGNGEVKYLYLYLQKQSSHYICDMNKIQ